jgi:hypothetical protein
MPQCQFPVSVVFVFQKSYTGNILGIGRNKSQNSYFSQHETKSEDETEGHERVAAPHHGTGPWPHHGMVWAPGPPPDAVLPPIYSTRRENLKARLLFHETYCKPPPSSMRNQEGPEALPSTLPERGITTGGLFHHHGHLRSNV